ncbi:hypothetical protein ACIBG8_32045 [Nonomuraea sp. NPDC050556]|uniref:hypothetical protein n=1 Tax=Nonomuraea sp. NPDC050556 TaxID=3364369 RepID=UPI0037A40917
MLSTELAALRSRARAARRLARLTLCGSIALLCCVQLLAERSPAAELAVLALTVFLMALPVQALTQLAWGVRMRRVRALEVRLYGVCSTPRWSRLAVAACWALTLLLGLTVPQQFRRAGLYGFADLAGSALEGLALAACVAGVAFCLWWARDARRPGPCDPWDPGRRSGSGAGWVGAALAVAVLVGARAHLWEPPVVLIYALLVAAIVCPLVTDE